MRVLVVMAALTVAMCASGCSLSGYDSPLVPPPGLLYSEIKVPLTLDAPSVEIGPADKRGESHTRFLWIPPFRPVTFAWATAAVKEAAQEGRISRIKHVDYEFFGMLLVYGEYKVIVYGD